MTFFTDSVFLQSLGYTLVCSLWQAMILWIVYRLIFLFQPKATALHRYNIGLLSLLALPVWSLITFIKYSSHLNLDTDAGVFTVALPISAQNINTVLSLFSVIYFILTAYHLLRFFLNFRLSNTLFKTGLHKPPLDIRLFVAKSALHLSIMKKVEVWMSEKVNVPSVIGFTKPVILLPIAFCNHLSSRQAEAVILHELAHIRRNDYLINIVQRITEAIYFYNPFLHLISTEIRKERENCCDDLVITHRYDKAEYSKALLLLEEQRIAQLSFALTATNGKKQLLNRIKRLFSEQNRNNIMTYNQLIQNSIFIVLLFLGIVFGQNNLYHSEKIQQNAAIGQITYANIIPTAYNNPADQTAINQNNIKKRSSFSTVYDKISAKPAKTNIVNNIIDNPSAAYINEDLLKPVITDKETIHLVSNAETKLDKQILVKIEDEQSGKDQNQTYYIELTNKDGKTTVKPLVILKKNNTTSKKLKDSSLHVSKKLRITS